MLELRPKRTQTKRDIQKKVICTVRKLDNLRLLDGMRWLVLVLCNSQVLENFGGVSLDYASTPIHRTANLRHIWPLVNNTFSFYCIYFLMMMLIL